MGIEGEMWILLRANGKVYHVSDIVLGSENGEADVEFHVAC